MKTCIAAILFLVTISAYAQGGRFGWTVAVTTAQGEHTEGRRCAIRKEIGDNQIQPQETLVAQCLRIVNFGPIGPPIGPGPYIPPPGLNVGDLVLNGGVYHDCVLTFIAINDPVLGSVQSLACEDN